MTVNNTKHRQAVVFGGTDGHGATMTVISERNLRQEGYCVETICDFIRTNKMGVTENDIPDYCGTGNPEYFWGTTFLNFDYRRLGKGDLVVVVDLPLPLQFRLTFSAADKAIERIKELCNNGIHVILIDHHKRAITHYGKAIEAGAEVVFTIGAEQYCHYGKPDEYSLFWGSIGAVCDRDPSMLPVEDDEKQPFEQLERYASWMDQERKKLTTLLWRIRTDNRAIPVTTKDPMKEGLYPVDNKVTYIEKLDREEGFKHLDAACAANKTRYGVGIVPDCSAIIAINYWKSDGTQSAIPIALQLPHYRSAVGHDNALVISLGTSDCATAKERMKEIIDLLNAERIVRSEGGLSSEADAVDYIAKLFKSIPPVYYLTNHGWNHVETVLANAKLLGAISDVTAAEQTLLNWCALFHDVGNGAMNYTLGVLSSEEARKHHHLYTVEILRMWEGQDLFKEIIPGKDLDLICELCEKHRKVIDLPTDARAAQLCALLRIADALDKTKSRARMNDEGIRYSEVRRIWEEEGKIEPTLHWEGQRAIESIRMHLSKDRIIFDFIVTDEKKAQFIIDDFRQELIPLGKIIPKYEVRTTNTTAAPFSSGR